VLFSRNWKTHADPSVHFWTEGEKMKKIVGLILLMALAAGLYAAAGPYITLYQIRSGVKNSDSEKISEHVDFATLRTNLKGQLHAHVLNGEAPDRKDNPFAAVAKGFVSKMADDVVDSYITPAGLTKLVSGKKRDRKRNSGQHPESGGHNRDLFQDARCHYDSLSQFSVRVKDDKDRDIRFILTRDGLSWKLSNIILPLGK